jgi:ATP diphosphatase
MSRAAEQIDRLIGIMARLRAPNGCPWDREQNLASLRPYLIEEAYEVLDAMDDVVERGENRTGAMRELVLELGDLLFQIIFHAQLAHERGEFEMADVIEAISDKIESRHPHVFGDAQVRTADDVLQNWAKLKEAERRAKGELNPSAIDGVPRHAPALLRAERTAEKAARVGFDWKDISGPRAKITEELAELDAAIASGDTEEVAGELGDLLFSVCNLARFTKTPAEDALRAAIARFESRFRFVESALRTAGRTVAETSPAELDSLWMQAKSTGK